MTNEDKKKYPMGIRQKMEVREPAVEYAVSKRIASPQEPVDRNAPLTRGEFRDTMLRVDDRLVQIDERFDRMDARLDKMDVRFDKIDTRLGEMDQKFKDIDVKFTQMDKKIATGFSRMEAQIERAQKRMALVVLGVVIALAGVYPGIIIGVLHYLK